MTLPIKRQQVRKKYHKFGRNHNAKAMNIVFAGGEVIKEIIA